MSKPLLKNRIFAPSDMEQTSLPNHGDLRALLHYHTWLNRAEHSIEPVEKTLWLSETFRHAFPSMTKLLDKARASYWRIDGKLYLLLAWDGPSGQPFGWLNILEQQPSLDLIEPHQLVLANIGGIYNQFLGVEMGESPFSCCQAGVFANVSKFSEHWSSDYYDIYPSGGWTPLDTDAWIAFAHAGNGDLVAYNPTDYKVYVFAHDFGFGFEGLTSLKGQPEMTFYTIDGVTYFRDFVEKFAYYWLQFVAPEPPIAQMPALPPAHLYESLSAQTVIGRALALGLLDVAWAKDWETISEVWPFSEAEIKWLIGFGQGYLSIMRRGAVNGLKYWELYRRELLRSRTSLWYNSFILRSSASSEADIQKFQAFSSAAMKALCFANDWYLDNEDQFQNVLRQAYFLALECPTLEVSATQIGERLIGKDRVAFGFGYPNQAPVWALSVRFGDLRENTSVVSFEIASNRPEDTCSVAIKLQNDASIGSRVASFSVYKTVFTNLEAKPCDYAYWLPENDTTCQNLRVCYNFIQYIVLITESGQSLILKQSNQMGQFEIFLNNKKKLAEIEAMVMDGNDPLERVF